MRKKKPILFFIIFTSNFLIFLFNLAPTVSYGDSAEFVIGAYKLSIVHPPGYPLYLLFGKLFTMLPVGDIAYRVNMMSAFFGALTCAVLFIILSELIKSILISFITSFTLTFSITFFHLSTIAEVYTLNSFFVATLLLILILWDKRENKRLLFIFSLLFGLSLTNHLTIAIFVPSFLIFFFLNREKISIMNIDILKTILLVILGLTPYLYIPIRSFSSVETIFWPKIKSFKEFISFVTASPFSVWIFKQNFKELVESLLKFLSFLLIQFPGFGTLFGTTGFFKQRKEESKLFILLTLMFLSLAIFGINYRVGDVHHFYLPNYLIFTIWIGYGIALLWQRTPSTTKHRILFFFTIILMFLSYKFTYTMLSFPFYMEKSFYFSDISKEGLLSVKENSLIICDWAHATLYRYWQMLYKIRRDVIVAFDFDENWSKYVDAFFGRREIYLSRFEKDTASKYYLIPHNFLYLVKNSASDLKEIPAQPQSSKNEIFFGEISLVGYDIIPNEPEKNILTMNLYWKSLKKTEEVYYAELKILDTRGRTLYFKEFRPVYGFYSSEKWKEGELLKEKINLYSPSQEFSQSRIQLNVFNRQKSKIRKSEITLF
ncbi:MAG: glycosyltransferase family 117 protein [Candidatus Aminicenantia bacterium]